MRFTGQVTGTALGFFPFSAITARRDDSNFRFERCPLTGFHNLTAGRLSPRYSLWVYSTPLALPGLRPSESDFGAIRNRFPILIRF